MRKNNIFKILKFINSKNYNDYIYLFFLTLFRIIHKKIVIFYYYMMYGKFI